MQFEQSSATTTSSVFLNDNHMQIIFANGGFISANCVALFFMFYSKNQYFSTFQFSFELVANTENIVSKISIFGVFLIFFLLLILIIYQIPVEGKLSKKI